MQHKPWTKFNHKIKLFCILPLYGHKESPTKREWRVLGIPVWVIRKRRGCSKNVHYYLFGIIKVMKISRKGV